MVLSQDIEAEEYTVTVYPTSSYGPSYKTRTDKAFKPSGTLVRTYFPFNTFEGPQEYCAPKHGYYWYMSPTTINYRMDRLGHCTQRLTYLGRDFCNIHVLFSLVIHM